MGTIELIPAIAATYVPAASFDPTLISGLVAWWDFSDISTLWQDTARTSAITANGQAIKGVTDKSGAGHHLSEATNGPTYTTAAQHGRSVARFDGVNDVLAATFTTVQPYTLVFAGSLTSSGGNDMIGGTPTGPTIHRYSANWRGGANSEVLNPAGFNASFHTHVFVVNGASSRWRIDASEASGNAGVGSALSVKLGNGNDGFGSCDHGDVLLYTGDVGTTAQATLEAGLKAKWGTP